MMDYTAGQNRLQGSAVSNEPGAGSSLNPTRPRTQTAGGGVSMNISTGGTHVLLFERDQQFAALLNNELQLAGYECHTARTAVEVFDAIARYSIRLVLVNLAQAAAARREFWVALDTQRRGRGVQVLTFHCSNLASYGPTSDDPDDSSHTMLADLEVDGMLGIMNMVNTIRSRIAVSNQGSMARLASSAQGTTAKNEGSRISQSTMPLAAATTNSNVSSVRNAPTPPPPVSNPPATPSFSPSAEAPLSPSRTSPINHTDKIRAVIYPNQRSWSTQRDADSPNSQSIPHDPPMNTASPAYAPVDKQTKNEETSWQPQQLQSPQIPTEHNESGLAQLSRMVQEHHAPLEDTMRSTSNGEDASSLSEATIQQQRVRPSEVTAIGALPLRASPIEDLPTDRITGNPRSVHTESGSATTRPDSSTPGNMYQNHSLYQPASTLASIAKPMSPLPGSGSPSVASAESAAVVPLPVYPEPEHVSSMPPMPPTPTIGDDREEEQTHHAPTKIGIQKPSASSDNADEALLDLTHVQPQQRTEAAPSKPVVDNTLVLDIVQSLPLMSPPPSQQQILSGRATRSLGSVLLEGHLVPQDRLEVAHGIQRMLRGVDMNYQLGEILLMFKLLTPDQLLAASLVSYGLITTAQIIALGRIRQELHSIGLEYDLENLLILFRILTSEQLREVRSSWAP